MISASIRFLRSPFRSEAPVAIAEGRKPPPVTGATAPHLALGPRPRPRSRPLLLSEYPREHLGPAPSYPGAGHVYRLRTVVRRGSGLPRAQPHSRPAPLIRCRRRHRRWAQRAAGIALHLPPWPPPPPPALAKDPALRRCGRRSHRRRYRVPRAPARRAASSPRNQWPAPPRFASQHLIGYPRPRRAIIRGDKPISGPVKAAPIFHWGAWRHRQLSHDFQDAAGPAKTARDEKFFELLEAWPIALPPDQEVGQGCFSSLVFQEAAGPLSVAQSGRIVIAPR